MIISGRELGTLRQRVTLVDGVFDPLHEGHVAYFREAQGLGLPLLCNVQGDAYIVDTKRRVPLLRERQRAEIIDALSAVEYVHICSTTTAAVLRVLAPAIYAKGADWRDRLPPEERAICEQLGIEIAYLDTRLNSSSQVVASFLSRAIESPANGTTAAEANLKAVPDGAPATSASIGAVSRQPAMSRTYSYVVSSHTNRYLSGVAKFNHLLAERLGAKCIGLEDAIPAQPGRLLLSVKLSDMTAVDGARLDALNAAYQAHGLEYDTFFHSYQRLPMERRLAAGSNSVFAANAEVAAALEDSGCSAEALWCPALLDADAPLDPRGLCLFSFGMSHKLQLPYYRMLQARLEGMGAEYQVLVSTAFHEKASFGDIDSIERTFRQLFGSHARLLGFLSDAAVNFFLSKSQVFCAFFEGGVRANNTSVYAAMRSGVPLLTNLDTMSPQWMQHGVNVLDIRRLRCGDLDGRLLVSLGEQGRADAEANASWDSLTERLLGSSSSTPAMTQDAG